MKKEIPTDRVVVFQLQYRKCGTPNCGPCRTYGHGPYWYAWWTDSTKKSGQDMAYVGRKLPPGLKAPRGATEFRTDPKLP